MRIIFTIIFCLALSLSTVVLPQDATKNDKASYSVSLGATFLTDSSFGGTGFNAANDAKLVQIAIAFPFSSRIWLGPTFTHSFGIAADADSLRYSEIGIQFLFGITGNIELVLNPGYAILEMNGYQSWLNVLAALRMNSNNDKWYGQTGINVIDGNFTLRSDFGLKFK